MIHASGSPTLFLSRDTSMRVRRFSAMQTPTVDGALSPDSTLAPPVVPQRSTRRATARRASDRRATARQHKDDIDGRIIGYVKEHPQGTTGDMAKGLNADRGTIAAEVSNMVRAGELTKGPEPHTLSATE
jgi:capsid protein